MKLGKKPVSPVFLDGILWIVMLKIDKFRHKSAKHIAWDVEAVLYYHYIAPKYSKCIRTWKQKRNIWT